MRIALIITGLLLAAASIWKWAIGKKPQSYGTLFTYDPERDGPMDLSPSIDLPEGAVNLGEATEDGARQIKVDVFQFKDIGSLKEMLGSKESRIILEWTDGDVRRIYEPNVPTEIEYRFNEDASKEVKLRISTEDTR